MTTTTNQILFRLETIEEDTALAGEDRLYPGPAGWFKIIQKSHDRLGVQYGIPLKHPDYSEELEQRLLDLELGDTIWLQLKSMNKRNTAWICCGFSEDEAEPL